MPLIHALDDSEALRCLPDLVHLLRDAVNNGASVGFLPPLAEAEARAYWTRVAADVGAGSRLLLAAFEGDAVQLALEPRPNGSHRAEVQKLLVLTRARRQGIGEALMAEVEVAARAQQRTLLVLDTRRGDPAEMLYRKLGYTVAGVIPRYARNGDGGFDDTVLFYRLLG